MVGRGGNTYASSLRVNRRRQRQGLERKADVRVSSARVHTSDGTCDSAVCMLVDMSPNLQKKLVSSWIASREHDELAQATNPGARGPDIVAQLKEMNQKHQKSPWQRKRHRASRSRSSTTRSQNSQDRADQSPPEPKMGQRAVPICASVSTGGVLRMRRCGRAAREREEKCCKSFELRPNSWPSLDAPAAKS